MSILDKVNKYGNYKELSPGEYAGPCPECGGAVRFRISLVNNAGKCQSCGYVLEHQETSAVSLFDADKMQMLISDTYSRVMSQCPTGAPDWLSKHRPEVMSHLRQISNQVDAAYAAEDAAVLQEAMQLWEKWHLAAWQRYEERPAVIARCKMEGGDCVCCGDCQESEEG